MPARKLGVVAGGGRLPGLLIEACCAEGRPHFLLGLKKHANAPDCGREPDAWVSLGDPSAAFNLLRDANVNDVVLVGSVRRPSLAEIRPDARTLRILGRAATGALGDDGLLRSIVAEIEREGFRVLGADEILAGLLAPTGLMGRCAPSEQDLADIARGEAAIRALGAADVGQATVVQQGYVLALEAAEGTAAMIERAGALRREGGGGVLVKCAKLGQDRRIDLPTIGPDTVRSMVRAKFSGIAVEVGSVFVIGRKELIANADQNDLFVIGRESVPHSDEAGGT